MQFSHIVNNNLQDLAQTHAHKDTWTHTDIWIYVCMRIIIVFNFMFVEDAKGVITIWNDDFCIIFIITFDSLSSSRWKQIMFGTTDVLCPNGINQISYWTTNATTQQSNKTYHKQVNSLRPRQNRWHFADDILKCIFLNENVWIPIEISLKFDRKGPIDNIPALV